jgi:serine/threonine protein kinase
MPEGKERSPATGSGVRGAEERLLAGRFLLLRQLGQGGMGRVWLAADETLGRLVAVKELRPPGGLAGPETHQLRALREARSAAGIKHPNAVVLHEVLSVPGDDTVYLIMEYVEGPTLGELIERHGPLSAPAVARYGLQLLGVLEAAHALGIVHRDVKPDNILIAPGDQAKLADFGIAYNVGDSRLTTAGVMGTRAYLAPELFDEEPITPAADLWSLGATLYLAAEGHGAFDREGSGPMLRAILVDDIPVPRCEPHLAAAVAGLLRREPHDRATIEQTRESLRRVPGQPALLPVTTEPTPPQLPPRSLSTTPPDPRPDASPPADPKWDPSAVTDLNRHSNLTTPREPPPAKPVKRHPALRMPGRRPTAIAAALLVLAAAGTAGGLLAAHARPGHASAVGVTRTGGTHSSASGTTAKTSAASGTPAHTRVSPTAAGTATAPSTGPDTSNGDLALSKTIAAPAGSSGIAYSPTGTLLAVYGKNDSSEAILLNTGSGTSTDLPFGTGAPDVAFSHDADTIAVAEHDGGVGLMDTATGKTSNVSDAYFATGIAFKPDDDDTMAAGDGDGVRLLTLGADTWSAPLAGAPRSSGPWTVLFSPDSSTLAAVDQRTGDVYVWNAGTGALEGTIPPPTAGDLPGSGTSIGYTPDSGLLAISYSVATATSPAIQFWAVQAKHYVVSHMQYAGVGALNALVYDPDAPDNYAVVGATGKVLLWEMPAGKNLGEVLNPGGSPLVDAAFSPGGSAIATLDANDRVALWSVS